jgi:hypothetical protein
MRRAIRSLVLTATAAAIVLPALLDSGAPAFARGPAGWRTVQEFGVSFGSPQIGSVVARGPRSAWVAGNTYTLQNSVFLAHWNGSRWSQVPGPEALTSTSTPVTPGPLALSGPNVWVFPTAFAAHNRVYAARLTSHHWTLWRLRGALAIDGAAVFGSSDVWAFGEALLPPGWTGLSNGPSYAERYDGRTWRRVHLPGVPLDVQALAPNDIWAYGPTNRTASAQNQDIVAMHWNGRTWSTRPIPRLRFRNGKLMFPAGLTVLKGNSLWVTEEFHCPTPACNRPQPPGIMLARWNGHRWVPFLESSSFEHPGAGPDGHDGLWLEAQTVGNPRWAFLHIARGRPSVSYPPATAAGSPANVTLPTPIPGTTSYWSTGDVQLGGGMSVAAVFKLGP